MVDMDGSEPVAAGGGGLGRPQMNGVRWAMFAYGVALLFMGVQSFFFPTAGHKPSMISLAAAGGMGFVALVLTYLAATMPNPRGPYIATLFLALFASSRFVMQLLQGKEIPFYPGYATMILSLGMIAVLVGAHFAAKKRAAT